MEKETEQKSDEYSEAIQKRLRECQMQLKGYTNLLPRSFKAVGAGSTEGVKSETKHEVIRVLQYNTLADGIYLRLFTDKQDCCFLMSIRPKIF